MEASDINNTLREELRSMHTYVHRFIHMRFTLFAGAVALVGALFSYAISLSGPDAFFRQCFLFVLIHLVIIFSLTILAALSRAIWVICAFGILVEKKLGYHGGQHHWVALNSFNSGYSTTHGIYRGSQLLFSAGFFITIALIIYEVFYKQSGPTLFTRIAGGTTVGLCLLAYIAAYWICKFKLRPEVVVKDASRAVLEVNALIQYWADGIEPPDDLAARVDKLTGQIPTQVRQLLMLSDRLLVTS
jgi:hypothetical protein